jgi:hypothetical protein
VLADVETTEFDRLFQAGTRNARIRPPEESHVWEDARRPHRIKFNLMVPADCEPTSVSCASAINRQVDRVIEGVST